MTDLFCIRSTQVQENRLILHLGQSTGSLWVKKNKLSSLPVSSAQDANTMYFKKCLHSHFPLEFIYAFVSLGLHKSTKLTLRAVLFIYSPVCSGYFLCICTSFLVPTLWLGQLWRLSPGAECHLAALLLRDGVRARLLRALSTLPIIYEVVKGCWKRLLVHSSDLGRSITEVL